MAISIIDNFLPAVKHNRKNVWEGVDITVNLAPIKALCKEKNITIADLEKSTGLSNGTVGKWATGFPRADNLKKVADYFGVTLDELMADGGNDGGDNDYQVED